MEYRTLGRTGVRVSPLCLGTMNFGGPTAEADAIEMIHKAIDNGVNFLDCANVTAKVSASWGKPLKVSIVRRSFSPPKSTSPPQMIPMIEGIRDGISSKQSRVHSAD